MGYPVVTTTKEELVKKTFLFGQKNMESATARGRAQIQPVSPIKNCKALKYD